MTKQQVPSSWRQSGLTMLWLSGLVVLLDQVTKQWILNNVAYMSERIQVLPFFDIIHVRNFGAAFSFLSDQGGWQKVLFVSLALLISAGLGLMLRRQPKSMKRVNIAFALIIGGAIGNVIDRVMLGSVVDFLDFYYGNYHWPAFNIADSAIVLGAITMVVDSFFAVQQQGKSNE
ncbi:lipoprotein signal peptidase [Aliidiomarina taiwanensis]|uniref:Lipoprotein signal peptidase n=1 Tax=Aliidiomarina taiwanensis TaxID=946228 RepID=A0A432X8H8_9GAMM|nr:signal peptidase II [Aliidiomarina taiwanensis]RUO43037.1 lipoprotein signal peptidase [Aliidiomarina taiwanensis]